MVHEYLNRLLTAPAAEDNKYSRGVLGFITGSSEYPGAALLGVTAAVRCGVGMVRYLGPSPVSNIVLASRPEAVIQPGRTNAWVIGSGMPESAFTYDLLQNIYLQQLTVLDAGALTQVDFSKLTGRAVLTPHTGELSRMLQKLGQTAPMIATLSPNQAAALAAQLTGQTVLLKGHQSIIAEPYAEPLVLPPATSWLATAGTGDVLGGIIGALLALHGPDVLADRLRPAEIAELAVRIHSLAGEIAAESGPPSALDVAESVRLAVRQLAQKTT